MSIQGRILLIDDDDENRRSLERALTRNGHDVLSFGNSDEALEKLNQETDIDLVVTDLRMPGRDGIGVLKEVKEKDPSIGVLLITGFGTVESAVEAMKIGADDFLTKPLHLLELRKRVGSIIEKRRLSQEVAYLQSRLDQTFGFDRILGRSAPMKHLFQQMRLVAPTRTSVLITGESGTGKELIANAIHQSSPRKAQRFIALNCAAIPKTLLESELFGHEKGSFTGATHRVVGKFELANGGTLFLDEVGELPPDVQVKLLRILEEKEFMRIGGSELIRINTRIVAATNQVLEVKVEDGSFRSDLYYRLKVVTLLVPPLRERREDIPLLLHHFFEDFKKENDRQDLEIGVDALHALTQARWDGNVRELRNLVESLVVLSTKQVIDVADLPPRYRLPDPASPAPGEAGPRTMEEIEREAILRTLEETGGNRTQAAEILRIGLRTLQRKLKEYGVVGEGT